MARSLLSYVKRLWNFGEDPARGRIRTRRYRTRGNLGWGFKKHWSRKRRRR